MRYIYVPPGPPGPLALGGVGALGPHCTLGTVYSTTDHCTHGGGTTASMAHCVLIMALLYMVLMSVSLLVP